MIDPTAEPKREEGEAVIAVVEEAAPKREVDRSRKTKKKEKPQKQPQYHVIIWNDEEHTYEYVIELLMRLFAHSFETAYQITHEVDHVGRGIAYTCHMELAELKRDQIHGYGADWRMAASKGPIRATIEEAPE
ncbi:MAG TPA: ATP-dependent Clp protease adaptor ClpS [Phycisphaerae bacterium]|nr:ATP-dependent Clp protease adaptor ClpS [Phycisphaerae bacterium]